MKNLFVVLIIVIAIAVIFAVAAPGDGEILGGPSGIDAGAARQAWSYATCLHASGNDLSSYLTCVVK